MPNKKQTKLKFNQVLATALITVLLSFTPSANAESESSIRAARGVLNRVLGEAHTQGIKLSLRSQVSGYDVYEYRATDGTLQVSGSSTVALCRGVYDYIRANKLGTVGWAGARLSLPDQWPESKPREVVTPFKIRHSYNVVTFGYTTPYWTWQRWQQELDWQAMHGYNMVLAPVATEAIATRVWKKMGLNQKEIDAFYTGPAHLPWQRMGNIQAVGGTLPPEWHTDQIALQKKLLARMRELGIEPVIQGFAGFVPAATKRIYPEAKLQATYWTGGFGKHQHPSIVMPDNPLFAKIMKSFLIEWKKEFGEVSHVLVDSFNEMQLPTSKDTVTKLLRSYGRNTYQALTAAIPDATWVLQGWMFSYQRNIWNDQTLGALVKDVPDDKLLILDYAHDYNPGWDYFSAFHGKTWAMGYVPNMGGKTSYVGKMHFYANQVAKVLDNKQHGNLVGFTLSGEGLENNEVLYELMSDTAWSSKAIDLDQWLPAYAANRYGSDSAIIKEAWQDLRLSVYSSFTDHPAYGWQKVSLRRGTAYNDPQFVAAIQKFLSVAPELESSANYTDDAVEMAAQALALRAQDWFVASQQALTQGMMDESKVAGKRGIELLLEADRLLESHSQYRLENWINFARSHSKNKAINDTFEHNARQLVTIWGPPINDYSCRLWSGLIRDYYVPRMQQMLESHWSGTAFHQAKWEASWVASTGVTPVKPYASPATTAQQLVERAYAGKIPTFTIDKANVIGHWTPAQMKTEWTTIQWELPVSQLKNLQGIRFLYTRGSHRLDIRSVTIVADGQKIAQDKHEGTTGIQHKNNLYTFKLPKHIQANNSCLIKAEVRSEGGTDSYGQLLLVNQQP